MENGKNNVAYMKTYLRYALEFEKYVYVWTNSMNEANKRMRVICDKRQKLESVQRMTQYQLDSLEEQNQQECIKWEKEAKRYRKSFFIALAIAVAAAVVMFAIGCGMGWATSQDPSDLPLPRTVFVFIIGACYMLIGFIPPLIVALVKNNSVRQCNERVKKLSKAGATKYKRILLENQENAADNDWSLVTVEEATISRYQQQIFKALNDAKSQLAKIYAVNVLPPKYRNLCAVATMYEYLSTGRCITIQGHGGIYDTYEVERIAIEQLRQLIQINERLSRIEDMQRYIYRELQQANQTLSGICSSLKDIQRTNEQIATNTAITAAASQQTAAATQWMSWHMYANS